MDAALCHQDGLERRRHPSTCQPRSEEQLFKSAVGRAQQKWSPLAAKKNKKSFGLLGWTNDNYASDAPLKVSGSAPTPPDSPSG